MALFYATPQHSRTEYNMTSFPNQLNHAQQSFLPSALNRALLFRDNVFTIELNPVTTCHM